MTASQVLFLLMAFLAVLGAVGVVFLESPVRAALALVVNFFVLGLMYFSMGAQMLGISQIMVYAGAIMVLFLFVVMMLRNDGKTDKPETGPRFTMALVGVTVIVGVLIAKLVAPWLDFMPQVSQPDFGKPQAIGYTLFTQYVWPFEVISVLLLIGIVGSIMLAKRKF